MGDKGASSNQRRNFPVRTATSQGYPMRGILDLNAYHHPNAYDCPDSNVYECPDSNVCECPDSIDCCDSVDV